jgi:hypothetical protein
MINHHKSWKYKAINHHEPTVPESNKNLDGFCIPVQHECFPSPQNGEFLGKKLPTLLNLL